MSEFKTGIISERESSSCRCRVEFAAEGIVSDWLPIVVPGTQNNKYFTLPDIGEQVVCLMDNRLENGVILGAIYSEADTPSNDVQGDDIAGVEFEDGTKVFFDRAASKLTVDTSGEVEIIAAGGVKIDGDVDITGDLDVSGNISAGGDVTAGGDVSATNVAANADVTAGGGAISLLLHVHNIIAPVPNTPTTPPIP